MCGITGSFHFDKKKKVELDKLKKATKSLSRRGPDFQQTWVDNNIGLGHARLSILDTSEQANQPMKDSTGRYVLIFNGEIYNYNELKKSISDVSLKSTGDTEVLLQLLIKEGKNCIKKLNGFFAFAFFDKEKHELLLARDRSGIKPLYYHRSGSTFCFGSEIKALLEYGIPKKLNQEAFYWYMQLSYVPGAMSMFEGVLKLEPGQVMTLGSDQFEIDTYLDAEPYIQAYTKNFKDSSDQLLSLLDESVKRRLISDVPLGSFLSGGIDSSAIVALASQYHSGINTFSIGYKDSPFFDETRYAELVANKFQTNHTSFSLSNDDLLNDLDNTISYLDEPLADPSIIPTYILSKKVKEKVTVALSGDGADELFGGYYKHYALIKSSQKSYTNQLIKNLSPALKLLPQNRNSRFSNLGRRISKYSELLKLSSSERYWYLASLNPSAANFLRGSISQKDISEFKSKFLNSEPSFEDYLLCDKKIVLEGNMLPKVDLMSMANGLEVRVPFLDMNVVGFAASLPSQFKVNRKQRKIILQETFKKILPQALYNRPKQGFDVPLLQWFKKELLSELDEFVFNKKHLDSQQLFITEKVLSLRKTLLSSDSEDSEYLIWTIYIFQKWYRRHF